MKFGLLTVSYSGLWHDGPGLTIEEQIEKAAALGYDGYLISEYCVPCMANHDLQGPAGIDEANELALTYMQAILEDVQAHAPAADD